MKTCNWIVTPLVALSLVACGGGGGGAGTQEVGTGSATGTGGGTVSAPTMTLQLLDSADRPLAVPSLSQTELRKLKVTLKDAKGRAQAFKRVTVTLDNALAVLLPQSGAQLTGADGVAWFTIAPASVTASGAVTATAKATLDGTDVSQTLDLQIEPGNVLLWDLTVTPTPVQLGQSVNVNAQVKVNGSPAASNSVTVAFSSGCGTVSPASVPVDASGRASAVIQTTRSGSCSVSASAAGVSLPLTAGFSVTAAPITGIQFVSASPAVIYQQDSAGVNSSLVKFKVIDSNGNPVAGQTVNADLINGSGGLHFCDSSASGKTAVSAATSGEVSFSVCSGTQPETAQVRARLTDPAIFTDSNILAVQTGLPTQRFFDIAADRLNFYAGGLFTSQFNNDGVNITVNLADRQGNPVPNGTPVALVTEGGQINSSNISSCIIDNGSCTVKLIGQEYRPPGASVGEPRPGRATVLAMADGEESFIDGNNNNRYDPGELFEDLGVPFIDKNEDGRFTAAYKNLIVNTNEGEVSYPIAPDAQGKLACLQDNANPGLSQVNTCNQVWNGSGTKPDGSRYTPTKVRRSIVIVFSGGEIGLPLTQAFLPNPPPADPNTPFACQHSMDASGYNASIPSQHHTRLIACSNTDMTVRLADWDGNPLPADAKLGVNVRKSGDSECTATLLGKVIGNSVEPTSHTALLEKCTGIGEWLDFSVEVGIGASTKTSVFSVKVPPPSVTP